MDNICIQMTAIVTEDVKQDWILLNRKIFQQVQNLAGHFIQFFWLEEYHIFWQDVSDCDASAMKLPVAKWGFTYLPSTYRMFKS